MTSPVHPGRRGISLVTMELSVLIRSLSPSIAKLVWSNNLSFPPLAGRSIIRLCRKMPWGLRQWRCVYLRVGVSPCEQLMWMLNLYTTEAAKFNVQHLYSATVTSNHFNIQRRMQWIETTPTKSGMGHRTPRKHCHGMFYKGMFDSLLSIHDESRQAQTNM